MPAITRNTDLSMGVCACCCASCPHTWISVHVGGSNNVKANGLGIMRRQDVGVSSCPHCPTSFAVTASKTVRANGRGVHRLGDTHNVACGTGVVITASHNVFAGE